MTSPRSLTLVASREKNWMYSEKRCAEWGENKFDL